MHCELTCTNNEQLDLYKLTLTKINKNSNCIAHGQFMLVNTLTNVK